MDVEKRQTVMKTLQNKIAVITGGSRGIGLALAQLLTHEGSRVVIVGRDRRRLKEAAALLKQNKAEITALPCDLSDAAQVEKLFKAVRKLHPTVDILVNNAGMAHGLAPVDQLPVEIWNQLIAANLTGMFLVTRAALPLMAAGGTIVNNISVAAVHAFAGMAAYAASKAGALGFTNVLREDLRKRGIRVLALMAGATDTEIWDQFWPDAPREKMVSPETVAQAVCHALTVPAKASIEEIRIGPAVGVL
jgi:NAD(P)-dependent dehydrogenase (short-subunit alcohol dehydrogenase family)